MFVYTAEMMAIILGLRRKQNQMDDCAVLILLHKYVVYYDLQSESLNLYVSVALEIAIYN